MHSDCPFVVEVQPPFYLAPVRFLSSIPAAIPGDTRSSGYPRCWGLCRDRPPPWGGGVGCRSPLLMGRQYRQDDGVGGHDPSPSFWGPYLSLRSFPGLFLRCRLRRERDAHLRVLPGLRSHRHPSPHGPALYRGKCSARDPFLGSLPGVVKNGLNIRSTISWSIPVPLSATAIVTLPVLPPGPERQFRG